MTLVSIPSNPVPEDVVSGTIKTPDGAELRFARWATPANRKGTVCVWSPGLNAAGTSLVGAAALERLVEATGWSIF